MSTGRPTSTGAARSVRPVVAVIALGIVAAIGGIVVLATVGGIEGAIGGAAITLFGLAIAWAGILRRRQISTGI